MSSVHELKPVESELQVTVAPRVAPVAKLPIGRWEIEGEGKVLDRRPRLRSDRRGRALVREDCARVPRSRHSRREIVEGCSQIRDLQFVVWYSPFYPL